MLFSYTFVLFVLFIFLIYFIYCSYYNFYELDEQFADGGTYEHQDYLMF